MIDLNVSLILKALLRAESAKFSALQTTVTNPKTLSKKLTGLVALRLVGKSDGLYRLTEKGRKVAELMAEIEDVLAPTPEIDVERVPHPAYRQVLRRFCELLLKRYGVRLVGVLLFGSVARGDWNESSDMDLMIVLDRLVEGRRGTLREMLKVKSDLRGTREYKEAVAKGFFSSIDVYPLGMDEATRFRRMYLDALTEGIVLFEKDEFLHRLIDSFRKRLRELGSRRIETPGVGHYWVIADVKPGEVIEL